MSVQMFGLPAQVKSLLGQSGLVLICGNAALAGPIVAPALGESATEPCHLAQIRAAVTPVMLIQPPAGPPPPGYANQLRTTPYGWPTLRRWCVWIEPVSDSGHDPSAEGLRSVQWQQAVRAALQTWSSLVTLRTVEDPETAQVRIWRRVPPLTRDPAGRPRASHGRTVLGVVALERAGGPWRLEPRLEVLVGPGQRREALQATVLHELGHAFGLWGHSDNPGDAMATAPGAVPVLSPSARDQATLRWLYGQPTRFGEAIDPATVPFEGLPRPGTAVAPAISPQGARP
jgi:hypothetical protein